MSQARLTLADYWMGRDKEYPPDEQTKENAHTLLIVVNELLDDLEPDYDRRIIHRKISSGYRPGHFNRKAGGASRSAHLTGEAVDLADPDGSLAQRLLGARELLEYYGLYMEHPDYTKGWVHLQTRPTKQIYFKPY